jgi:hypothetical protein
VPTASSDTTPPAADPCHRTITTGARLSDLADDEIAAAVVAGYDATRHRFDLASDAGTSFTAHDCRGSLYVASPYSQPIPAHKPAGGQSFLPAPRPEGRVWIRRYASSESRAVVTATLAMGGGLCLDPEGFVALVGIQGSQLVVEAVTPWATGGCEAPTTFDIVHFGTREALLESASGNGESGPWESEWVVWTVMNGTLTRAGRIRDAVGAGNAEYMVGDWSAEMRATHRDGANALDVEETWRFRRPDPAADGGYGPAHARVVRRTYTLGADGGVNGAPHTDPTP